MQRAHPLSVAGPLETTTGVSSRTRPPALLPTKVGVGRSAGVLGSRSQKKGPRRGGRASLDALSSYLSLTLEGFPECPQTGAGEGVAPGTLLGLRETLVGVETAWSSGINVCPRRR